MKRWVSVFMGLMMVVMLTTLACALPTPPANHMLSCDALPASDNDTGVDIYYSQTIVSITKANPGVVTTALPHGLTTGNQGMFTGLVGMTQLNNVLVTVTVVNSTSFSIGVNTTSYGTYTAGSGGFFDNSHRVVDGRIDTTPYDLNGLTLPIGTYPIAATAVNTGGESGFSNVLNFTMPVPPPVVAPGNLKLQ